MNIAFPAFFLLALVLTGVIFLNAYERRENTNLEKIPFSSTSARAIIASGLIHIPLLLITHHYIVPVDFEVSIKLITGTKLINEDIAGLSKDVLLVSVYFLTSYFLAVLLGKLIQIILLNLAPYKSSRFAFDTPWYYELKGKLSEEANAEIIKLSCLVDSNGGSYLYYGYLEDFYLDDNGQLDRIVLSDVYRRNLGDDEDADADADADTDTENAVLSDDRGRFYQIKGDRLVLKYDRVINLNIEYLYLMAEEDTIEDNK